MQDLLYAIKKANGEEIDEILKAVLSRFGELYPEWELSTVSVLKSENRNEQLDRMILLLQKMKTLNT